MLVTFTNTDEGLPAPHPLSCYRNHLLRCVLGLYSRTKDYGMPNICPWSLDALEYDGCCTHIAFAEGIYGEDGGATLEQIAAKQVEIKEKTRQLQAAVTKRGRDDNRDSRRYACDLCNTAFRSQSDLNLHNVSKKHIDKANGVNKVVKDPQHSLDRSKPCCTKILLRDM